MLIERMRNHLAAAVGADLQINTSEREESFLPRRIRFARGAGFVVGSEMSAGFCKFGAHVATGEQAVVTNLDVPVRKDVEEETADELLGSDNGVLSVLGAEADSTIVEGDEPVVGNADAMGITAQVLEDLLRPGERALRIDHPILAVERIHEPGKHLWIGEVRTSPAEVELAAGVASGKRIEELAAEEIG